MGTKYQISKPLAILFNKALNYVGVPVISIFANDSPIQINEIKHYQLTYRSINLTSGVSKLMETVIPDELVSFLEEHFIIDNVQRGFCNIRSC